MADLVELACNPNILGGCGRKVSKFKGSMEKGVVTSHLRKNGKRRLRIIAE